MEVWFGAAQVMLNEAGAGRLRLAEDQAMNGHLGYLKVSDSTGNELGEIEVLPGKLSQSAYEALRADLVRVWGDLIFDPEGVTGLSARPPSASELLARIERPLRQILDQPAEQLVTATAVRRLDRIRHPREMRPAVVRAGMRGAPALTRVIERSVDTPEQHLVVATLHRLRQHARRDREGAAVARRIDQLLTGPFAGLPAAPVTSITWGMRTDPRYRQVLAVYRALDQPYLHATEGPGELRLGVRGMVRLYEYWVYLQVLQAAREMYGPPLGAGFNVLAVEQRRSRTRRLELPAGTTISFPGDVHIAFEPEIKANSAGWMNIEYVPHPDPGRYQFKATPDVVILRGGQNPRMTVIDAKYVGRVHVEQRAAELHEKYSRMRLQGKPIVDWVYAAHPHTDLNISWAGYGHIGLAPGDTSHIPLPPVGRRSGDVRSATSSTDRQHRGENEPVAIIADLGWLLQNLDDRHISLSDLGDEAANGRPVRSQTIVMPNVESLQAFAAAATHNGWHVQWATDVDRLTQLEDLARLVEAQATEGHVIVVSGDQQLLARLPPASLEIFRDLSALSDPAIDSDLVMGTADLDILTGANALSDSGQSVVDTADLMAFVRQLVAGLDRPVTLGGLAEATSRQFGTSATANWGGFNKFKKLLEAACPDVTIDDGGAGFVVPPGTTVEVDRVEALGAPLPPSIQFLRLEDPTVPNVAETPMRELIAAVELALDPQVWSQLAIPSQSFIGVDAVNILSAHARDAFTTQGRNVARRHVDHLMKVLLFEGELRPGLAQQELLDLLGDYFINSATRQGYAVTEADISDIRDWLRGK